MRLRRNFDCLPGLLPASFRGVPFWVLDADHEAGRRMATVFFPGRDGAWHDDLGLHTGPISLNALVIGDDYIQQANRLQGALNTPGPGTLVHPWLGEKWVVCNTPANINYSSKNLRVVTFDLTFEEDTSGFDLFSTVAGLIASVSALFSGASYLVASIMGTASVSLAAWTTGREALSSLTGDFLELISRTKSANLYITSLSKPQDILKKVLTQPAGPDTASSMADTLITFPKTIQAIASTPLTPAIGLQIPRNRASHKEGAILLLKMADQAASYETITLTDASMALGMEAACLAAVAALICEIDFENRQEAMVWRTQLNNALTQCLERTVQLAQQAPESSARLRASLSNLQANLALDMNETIGRLPAIQTVTPVATVSAFLLAQHYVGDDPQQVVPMVHDLWRRNRLRHPGSIPADPVEVLL